MTDVEELTLKVLELFNDGKTVLKTTFNNDEFHPDSPLIYRLIWEQQRWIDEADSDYWKRTPRGDNEYKRLREKKNAENEKENLQFRKLKLDVELGEKVVKNYPMTKRIAKYAILIAGISLLLTLIKWICKVP